MRVRPFSKTLGAARSVRAWGVRALAAWVVLAHGAALGHDLIERHEVCPEHGELIHAADAAHAAADASRARTDEHAAAVWSGGAGEAHEHEHCGLACTRQKLATAAPSATVLVTAPDGGASEPPVQLAAPDLRERHRLAPKQSPPV